MRSTTRCRTSSSAMRGCSGKDARWVVGTDHAGIATQMVVERRMALQQQKRTDFTRDEFVDKIWEWKAESGGDDHQPACAGSAARWIGRQERFTMDEGFSAAVRRVFVRTASRGVAVPRQEAGELGPGPRHRDQRPGGRDARGAGRLLASALSVGRTRCRRGSRSRRRGPRRCSPTWRWPCIPMTSAIVGWSASRCGCR